MDAQKLPAQGRGVAHPPSGPEVLHVIGDEAHPGALDEVLHRREHLLQAPVRVVLQELCGPQDDGPLPGRDGLGVDAGDVVPALDGDLGALVGAGGNGGVGEVENLSLGSALVDGVKDPGEVLGHTSAGLGELAGALVVGADLLGGEGTIVPGLRAEGYVHGHDFDAPAAGGLGGDVRPGLGDQDNGGRVLGFSHGGSLAFFSYWAERDVQSLYHVFSEKSPPNSAWK